MAGAAPERPVPTGSALQGLPCEVLDVVDLACDPLVR